MNSLHAEDVSKASVIMAGNELSFLQQIQGGQQIDEESSAIHGSRISRILMGNQLANRRWTYFGVLRTLIIKHSNLWFISA